MPSYLNFRLRGIPLEYETRAQVRDLVSKALGLEPSAGPTVYSLAVSPGDQNIRTATLSFSIIPDRLKDRSETEWVIDLPDEDDFDFGKFVVFDTHFAGFTPLQRTGDHDCHVDLIIVCGLGGHALGSFKEKAGRFVWLRDALPLEVPHARVLTYGYNSELVQSSSFQSLTDLGRALQLDLEGIRDPSRQRPIVFIGHSLGGLVIKETILRLKEEPLGFDTATLDAISGFLFFGVPHQGLAIECLVPLVKDSPNRALLESLNKNSALLQRLQREFRGILSTRHCPVISFYETKESPTGVQVKRGTWKMIGPSKVLVDVSSATCGSQRQHPIDRNHSEMVKYSNAHDVLYKRVMIALRPLTSNSGSRRYATGTGVELDPDSFVLLSESQKDCLRSLSFQEQAHRHSEIHYAKDTCEWILEDSQYQAWMNKPRGLFWIKGNPGTGKSALMKFIVDMMQRSKSGELIVSFFFHGRGVSLQRSPLGMFRALLNSMLRSFPEYLDKLTKDFEAREDQFGSYERTNGWRWTEIELEQFMSEVLVKAMAKETKRQPVVIFVDALDECGEGIAKRLLAYFKNIMNDAENKKAPVKICFSSRHYPILSLETMPKIYMEERNDRDIRLVIQTRLKEIKPAEKRREIETEILLKAHGGFQWAMLIIDMIDDQNITGVRTQNLLRNITTIPEDLNELYSVLLSGATQDEEYEMTKLFQWILFAERPLSTSELREALAIDQDMAYTTFSELRSHDNYSDSLSQFEIRVRHISRGLVEFHTRDIWELYEIDGEDWDREAQFVHQSAADFVGERFLSRVDHGLMSRSVIGAGHYRISRSCLRYLTLTEVIDGGQLSRGQLSTKFPLMPYTVAYIFVHINAVEQNGIQQTDLLAFIQFDRPDSLKKLAKIWRVMDPDGVYAPMGWPFETATPLHILIAFGSASFLDTFLQKDKVDLDARDCRGNTPILLALDMNRQDLALLLLDRSVAWQNEQDKPNSNVARSGSKVQRMNYLAHINARNSDGETPCDIAVSIGADKAIQSLIDAGAHSTYERELVAHTINTKNRTLLSKLMRKGVSLDGAVFLVAQRLNEPRQNGHNRDNILHEMLSDLLGSGVDTKRLLLYDNLMLTANCPPEQKQVAYWPIPMSWLTSWFSSWSSFWPSSNSR